MKWEMLSVLPADVTLNFLQGSHRRGNGGMCAGGGETEGPHLCRLHQQAKAICYGPGGEDTFRNRIGVPAVIPINGLLG